MQDTVYLPRLELLEAAATPPVRDYCCLRYKRRGTSCPGCRLRPENRRAAAEAIISGPRKTMPVGSFLAQESCF
jgi:hypothetical protein